VTAANNALTEIGSQTAYTAGANGAAGTAGALIGESSVQSLQGRLLGAVSAGALNFGSFQQLGLQLDKTGKLTFDSAAFVAAYQANPSGVQTAVQNGVAASMDAVAIAATNSTTGTLTTAIQGRTDDVTSLTGQIDQWATRLNERQAALQAQFTQMEVALGKLKDQSNWLTGQLASLPTNLSNSGKG
jgi:flagellar hook-associated protein 2